MREDHHLILHYYYYCEEPKYKPEEKDGHCLKVFGDMIVIAIVFV
jgi:hypothetical protein